MRSLTGILLFAIVSVSAQAAEIQIRETDKDVEIETDALIARINKKGYVSGVAAGSMIDKKTSAKEVGFGLHIMDFLLAPGWRDDGYTRERGLHGNLPKHYVEGPQICTQAKKLQPEIIRGAGFVAVRLRFRFTTARADLTPGSEWKQTMVFQPGLRYFLSSEQITSVNEVDDLFYRIDMPGHLRHERGDTFTQIYLSYVGEPIPASAFYDDFAPDDRFLYQRQEGRIPARMIRAYQVKLDGKPGPWLGGLTLDPAMVSEAWCHQRGYVCFIQELHQRKVKVGETFGAAYAVGWFGSIEEMEQVSDRYHGKRSIHIDSAGFHLE